jgi:hypothetical protein
MAISEINDKSLAASAVNLATNTVTGVLPAANTVANLSSGNNLIINGAMQIAQRGTSSTTASAYLVDRFKTFTANTDELAFTQAQVADGPDGFSHSYKFTTTTAESALASDESVKVRQTLEGQNVQQLKYGLSSAEQITLSFYVKGSVTGAYAVTTNQTVDPWNVVGSTYTISSANTWEKKIITFPANTLETIADNSSGGIYWDFYISAGSNYTGTDNSSWGAWATAKAANGQVAQPILTANSTWQLAGLQIEVGSVATPFDHRSYGEELALCQRYFYIGLAGGTGGFGNGSFRQNNESQIQCIHPQVMRANPTATLRASGSVVIHDTNDGNNINVTAIQSTLFNSQKGAMLGLTLASSSGVVGEGCWTYGGTSTPGITFDAEL